MIYYTSLREEFRVFAMAPMRDLRRCIDERVHLHMENRRMTRRMLLVMQIIYNARMEGNYVDHNMVHLPPAGEGGDSQSDDMDSSDTDSGDESDSSSDSSSSNDSSSSSDTSMSSSSNSSRDSRTVRVALEISIHFPGLGQAAVFEEEMMYDNPAPHPDVKQELE